MWYTVAFTFTCPKYVAYMHCFKDVINNRKYFLHFIRLLLPPKSPISPNLGGDPYFYLMKKQVQEGELNNALICCAIPTSYVVGIVEVKTQMTLIFLTFRANFTHLISHLSYMYLYR